MRLNLIMGMIDKITAPIQKVTTATDKMGERIKKTQGELSRLGNTTKDIEHFKALDARSTQTAQALAQAQAKAQALGQQMGATANPTRKMTNELARAAEQVNRLQAQQQAERLELQRTGQQLNAAGVSTGKLAVATRRIEEQTRKYNEQLTKEKKSLAEVATQQKRLGEIKQRNSDMKMSAATDAIGVGVAIAGAKQLVTAYGDVVTARNEGLALGLDTAGIDSITAKAKAFSDQWSGTTQVDFINGAVEIKSAIDTLGAEAIGDFTKIAALVAKSTKSTTTEMTSLMATGYGVYRHQFDAFGKTVVAGWEKMSAEERDIEFGKYFAAGLVETVNVFKSDGQQMSAALTALGATATSANIPFAEQLAILGQLQLTMSGSEAATKYRAFVGAASGAAKKLGMSFMDANHELLSMPEILEKLHDKFGDTLDAMETKKMKDAFGTDEAIALIQLLYPEMDSLKKNIGSMGEALKKGMSTTERMAEVMNSGPNEAFKVMSQRVQNTAVTLGGVLAPAMIFVAGMLGGLASFVGNLAERFPFLTQVIGFAVIGLVTLQVASITARFGFAMLSNGIMTASKVLAFFTLTNLRAQAVLLVTRLRAIGAAAGMGVLIVVSRSFAAGAALMTAAQWALNVAMTANPIGLVIAGLAALVAVVALVIRYWEPLSTFFGGLWDSISGHFTFGLEFIRSLLTWSPLGAVLSAWEPLTGFFDGLWAGIKSTCGAAMDWIAEKVMGPIQTIRNFAGGIFGSDSPAAAAPPQVTDDGTQSPGSGGVPAPGAGSVGSVAAPSGRPSGVAAAPAGPTTIQVYAAPGMSEEEVAKKVAAELDARDRKNARNQRGRLGDGVS